MDFFAYQNGELFCEEVPVYKIIEKVGSPVYIYTKKGFQNKYLRLKKAFEKVSPLLCYSVKSNSHLSILSILKQLGSGFDVVSGGELARVEHLKADWSKVVFAGVGKSKEEIEYALEKNILMFNVESIEEAYHIHSLAKSKSKIANIALRLNPDVDPVTHKYITTGKKENKFGIHLKRAKEFILQELPSLQNLSVLGIHLHIGSQIQSSKPYKEALQVGLSFVKEMKKSIDSFQYINIGGGYGISYEQVEELDIDEFSKLLIPMIQNSGLQLIMEPGRFISANSGILVTKILYKKEGLQNKRFLICDSGMHHLLRPTLYQAFHQIWPIQSEKSFLEIKSQSNIVPTDVVGPICESGDFFAKNRDLPSSLKSGDYLAIFSAGAYGACMSSKYNSHSKPMEVLVDGEEFFLISKKESWVDLLKQEII